LYRRSSPVFVRRQYREFNVKPVGLLPWNGSIKIFGLPLLRCVFSADVFLVTDAILFDLRLFNPLFNYLSTLALFLPLAKSLGRSVILYNVNLGPIHSRAGRWCLNRVLGCADRVIVRDSVSLKEIPPGFAHNRLLQGADSALNATASAPDRVEEILRKEGLARDGRAYITLTANSYINAFRPDSQLRMSEDQFVDILADAANRFMDLHDVDLAVVVTQVMDTPVAEKLLVRLKHGSRARLLSTRTYSFAELAGVFGRARMHVGARTHSLILAASQSTPVIAILVTPKNRGFMESIDQSVRMVEMEALENRLYDVMLDTWEHRSDVRRSLETISAREKEKARAAVSSLASFLPGGKPAGSDETTGVRAS